MLSHRIFHIGVILCWLGSMSWLLVAKVIPSVAGGDPPDYTPTALAENHAFSDWRIRWNDQTIGYAASRSLAESEGQTEIRSVVQCEDLPVAEITRELMGAMAFLAEPLFRNSGASWLDLLVATRMHFDASHRLTEISSAIDLGDSTELFRVRGTIDEQNNLRFVLRVGSGPGVQEFRRTIELPPGTLVNDALAPRAELRNLYVGQAWNVPVYRLFPPGGQVQFLRATVERHEVIFWDGRDVETKLVVYRTDPTSNVGAAREVMGREWIAQDGRILQQEISFASVELRFERVADGAQDPRAQLLDPEYHPRLWRDEAHLTKVNDD